MAEDPNNKRPFDSVGEAGDGADGSPQGDPFGNLRNTYIPGSDYNPSPNQDEKSSDQDRRGKKPEQQDGKDHKEHKVGRTNWAERQKEKLRHPVEYYAKKKAEEAVKEEVRERVFKKAGKEAGKRLAKKGVQQGTQAAAKVGTKVGADVAIEGGLEAAGAAAAPETLGLSFVIATLLAIAINLGVEDAIHALSEMKKGNLGQARYLAVRAATKVGMFIYFLLVILMLLLVPIGTIAGLIGLFWLNVYMFVGTFVDYALLQGLVWWEKIIILIVDGVVIFMTAAIALTIFIVICAQINSGFAGFLIKYSGATYAARGLGAIVGVFSQTAGDAISGTAGAIQGAQEACDKLQGALGGVFGGGATGADLGPGGRIAGTLQGNGVSCDTGMDTRGPARSISSELEALISEASRDYGVDINIIRAIGMQENSWRGTGSSDVGAQGYMQVMPDTARGLGCASDYNTNARSNIRCGTLYLKRIINNKNIGPYGRRYVFSAYNAGEGSDAQGPSSICDGLRIWECPFTNSSKTACQGYRYTRRDGSLGWTYKQTRDYVISVERFYQEYSTGRAQ